MSRSRLAWLREPWLLVELFVLFNLAGLAADIRIAHAANAFAHPAEWIPFWVSIVGSIVLGVALASTHGESPTASWRWGGLVVGWLAVLVGLAGTVLHLGSGFFRSETLHNLVYAAPFAAPLAYTGLGLLLIANRMVERHSEEWARWVVLLALGGLFGNFVFSLTDHAQNGFFDAAEWVPVFGSAFAVGFVAVPLVTRAGRPFVALCGAVLGAQAGVGIVGFVLHTMANLAGPSPSAWDNVVYGAPPMAPLLFPDLAILAWIGLSTLGRRVEDG